ncbi:GntR family transcriptional regulator [Falsirhodobacter sp. 20TX0035]|uniref:GntR family transcriptional regulator n=1 Tax=Falsirhodobacter sp. 20TX0035 TaxID=3022019 RepID=UPI00232F3159|nr:GntR family transcriptional regulator [Falsirhodobacter sp. 20TX0035]MDB6455094.1 GntR family transcriptional regulator [Falsirhodobacter sp. 20TX0035]
MNDKRDGKVEQVVDTLRAEITGLVLVPGQVLSRPALQERFGLSSTPLRDALIRLEGEGLVEIRPQSRTTVSLIDLEAAHRAHILRRALDMEVAQLVLSADAGPTLDAMAAVLERQAQLLGPDDRDAFDALDTEFHLLQYLCVGMEELWRMTQARSGHINRIRRMNLAARDNTSRILEDHRAIHAALVAGDPAGVAQAVRHHLTRSANTVGPLREVNPSFFR